MVFLHGLMEDDMKVNMLMIRKRVKVDSTGLMEENTREDGETASSMELEPTPQLVVRQSKESGKKEKDCIGFLPTISDFLLSMSKFFTFMLTK